MPRLVPSGTPSKTNRYVFPPGRLKLWALSLAIALGLAVILAALVVGGSKSAASPGPLASAHAPFESRCADCHAPKATDVRCERCHDPFGSNRFQNAGHVWFGTRDPVRVSKAVAVECSRCHNEHLGRDAPMQRVDDRRCAACHFPSLARHPEFALVKAGVMKDEGLSFSHRKHLKAVRKANLDLCQYCHEPTRNRKGFQPLNFDRQCSKCHLPGGSMGATEPIPADAVVLPQQIDAPWARERGVATPDKRGIVIVGKLMHKDPWVVYNLWKLAREIDPEGFRRKRSALEQRIAALSAQMREPPTRGISRAALHREEQDLSQRVAAASKEPGNAGERRKLERALARVKAQIELGSVAMAAPRQLDWSQIDAELKQRRSELADFDMAGSGGVPLTPAQRDARLAAAAAMTAPCALCHVYNDGIMAPLRAAVPVLGRANFTHLPHLEQIACFDCHNRIASSGKAQDVNLPAVARCRDCHRPTRARSDCAGCHSYHPGVEPWPPI